MEIINEIKEIKVTVQFLITKYPHLRDSDSKLIATVWHNQIKNKTMPVMEFLNLIADGKLVNPESIRRSRQLLQKNNPELRGTVYNNKSQLGSEFKDKINAI
jgi:hypothetical protein